MQRSETITNLAAALAKAQAQVKGAVKDSANPFFKSKYADLASVWEACRDACNANDLAIVQFPIAGAEGFGVETVILHASGEWMSSEFVLPASKMDAQGAGSCITYARRYAVAAVLRVCPEDDDGNAAAAGIKKLQEEALKMLEKASTRGLVALENVWKALPEQMRKACQHDLAGLKEKAKEVKETQHA